MKKLGKTPSIYNGKHLVAGISDWAQQPPATTDADLDKWMREPDYGICVRTGRGWLGIDSDVLNADYQQVIRELAVEHFGELPHAGTGRTATSACT